MHDCLISLCISFLCNSVEYYQYFYCNKIYLSNQVSLNPACRKRPKAQQNGDVVVFFLIWCVTFVYFSKRLQFRIRSQKTRETGGEQKREIETTRQGQRWHRQISKGKKWRWREAAEGSDGRSMMMEIYRGKIEAGTSEL